MFETYKISLTGHLRSSFMHLCGAEEGRLGPGYHDSRFSTLKCTKLSILRYHGSRAHHLCMLPEVGGVEGLIQTALPLPLKQPQHRFADAPGPV